MKRIILILILLILSTVAVCSQKLSRPNTIYFVYDFVTYGMGVRYDRAFSPYWGSYMSLLYGDYALNSEEMIDNYYKLTSGVLIYLTPHHRNRQTSVGVGLCYNVYEELYDNPPQPLPSTMLDQWSFELSGNVKVANKFNVGLRIDPIILNGSLDLGFSF